MRQARSNKHNNIPDKHNHLANLTISIMEKHQKLRTLDSQIMWSRKFSRFAFENLLVFIGTTLRTEQNLVGAVTCRQGVTSKCLCATDINDT